MSKIHNCENNPWLVPSQYNIICVQRKFLHICLKEEDLDSLSAIGELFRE